MSIHDDQAQQAADEWLRNLDSRTYTLPDGRVLTQAQFEAARNKALRESEPFL
jgi:hypothetical protein